VCNIKQFLLRFNEKKKHPKNSPEGCQRLTIVKIPLPEEAAFAATRGPTFIITAVTVARQI